MKILYAIQGTGNGHISRARDIIPILQKRAEVDILISGSQADVSLPFEIKYKFKGLGFVFGKKGGVDLFGTLMDSNLPRLMKEINSLPVEEYDLVINDFEPVSAWACQLKNLPCISLSHQCAVINKRSPKPKQNDVVGKTVLKRYAPATAYYGFHFDAFDKNIFTPVIRREIRELEVSEQGHYTVYLPSYDDARLIKHLSRIKNVKWEVFSKHNTDAVKVKNVTIRPINNQEFIHSMATSSGVLCGAGFETPAEALFLNKKLMVIPMKNQYEQHCNAAALKALGVLVIKSLKKKHLPAIDWWTRLGEIIKVNYPDITEQIIGHILETHLGTSKDVVPVSKVKKFKFA